ncbi:MAG TPA: acetyl-CoA hydrolase/transferase C-terminal domain-containing protein [Nocardioidaceae bacterium]|nr:acetyl-CoA hydrolase/transferase C-terminal domain-containing protein [Nocardioidaceae bacterium]
MKSLRQALSGLPEQPRIVTSGSFATPRRLLEEVDRLLPTYRVWAINAQHGVPDREGVELETPFVGPGMRSSPRLHYMPSRLSLVPTLFERASPPDVVLVHTSLPRNGSVSLGTDVSVLPAAIEAVRRRGGIVLAQANRYMPYTYGDGVLGLDDVDLVVEVNEPLPAPQPATVDDASAEIGERVASRVGDGATLQAGIGAVPDAALARLRDRRDLRVWTEMFTDSILELERAGALDQNRPITTSFLFGSQELYEWLDGNPRVRMARTETTNDPAAIARNHAMTSINTALQVDLLGQANASRIHARIYSGFGGQTDFIVGALHSWNGQALIALRSWHPRARRSTIVPLLDEPVTSFQMTAVVTEQGVAGVFGHDQQAQARNLIEEAAHPDVREELWEEAHALGLA